MKYGVNLPDGTTLDIEIADRLDFDPPLRSLDELRAAIAAHVSKVVAPRLSPRFPEKRVERDATGRIDRLVEFPALSVEEQAQGIGRQVAAHYVSGIEE